jgi:sugar lactone lactonase YvrE
MPAAASPSIHALQPPCAVPGGRVTITGTGLSGERLPTVHVGGAIGRVVGMRDSAVRVQVPADLDGGVLDVRIGSDGPPLPLHVGRRLAEGLHQVDNPVFDARGRLYVTYSGSRGEEVPVSIFRVAQGGARESFSSAVVNPTSMTIGPDGALYVSSRFEGTVYRVADDGSASSIVTDAGVACGLAFAPDGALFIGDRSGTILRAGDDGRVKAVVSLPPSVAAFHLAFGPDGWLYVTAPTLGSADRVYRISHDGATVDTLPAVFGRPQGLAFDRRGTLYVVDALAGASGLYRVPLAAPPELVVSADSLVGVAFDPSGGFVVASNDTAYRFDDDLPG